MGKVTAVTVSMGRTYNMGDYEFYRIDGAVTSAVDSGEDPAEVARKSFPILRAQMKETYTEFKPPKRTTK